MKVAAASSLGRGTFRYKACGIYYLLRLLEATISGVSTCLLGIETGRYLLPVCPGLCVLWYCLFSFLAFWGLHNCSRLLLEKWSSSNLMTVGKNPQSMYKVSWWRKSADGMYYTELSQNPVFFSSPSSSYWSIHTELEM